MQKFIHDNEQYVLEVKKKNGKTKIDRELNDYLRKNNNNLNSFSKNFHNNNKTHVSHELLDSPKEITFTTKKSKFN